MTALKAWQRNLASSPEVLAQVKKIARKAKRDGRRGRGVPESIDIEDLEQEGFLGLLQAVRRFDPSRGTTLGAFAARRIYGAMIDAHRRSAYRDDTLDPLPGDEARGMSTPGGVEKKEGALRVPEAMRTAPAQEFETLRSENRKWIQKAMLQLSELDRTLVSERVFLELYYSDIGRRHGHGAAWAFHAVNAALDKLRVELAKFRL